MLHHENGPYQPPPSHDTQGPGLNQPEGPKEGQGLRGWSGPPTKVLEGTLIILGVDSFSILFNHRKIIIIIIIIIILKLRFPLGFRGFPEMKDP